MQENEMLKLFQAIREIFPESFLQLLDKNNHIIQETPRSEYYPDEPVSYSGFKEIVSLKNAQGEAFYKLTFPIAPIYMLRLLIPAAKTEDVFTSAKMTESIIQLFQAKPARKAQTSRQSDMALLLDHLLHPTSTEDHTYTALLAAELDLDMSLPRAVCLLQFQTPDGMSPSAKAAAAQAFFQMVRHFISSAGNQDILGNFGSSEIILCHVMAEEAPMLFFDNLYDYLKKNSVFHCSIAVGLTVNNLNDYASSFSSAKSAFRYASSQSASQKNIYFVTAFLAEHLVYQLPETLFEHFFQAELSYLESNATAVKTIQALVKNNMDLVSSAEDLFIHRNTMVFRLNQLKKSLNLNPLHKDNDRFKLILLYHYYRKIHSANTSAKEAL